MADLIGLWDCDSCGLTNTGTNTKCDSCSASTPKTGPYKNAVYVGDALGNSPYYLGEKPKTVSKKEEHITKGGSNWRCSHCSTENHTLNKDLTEVTECKNCGNSHDHQDQHRLKKDNDYVNLFTKKISSNKYQTAQFSNNELSQKSSPSSKETSLTLEKRREKKYSIIILLSLISVVLIFICYYFFFSIQEFSVKAIDKSWERTLEIQKEVTVIEEGWSIPSGGRKQRSWRAQSGTKQVQVGTETESYRCQTGSETYNCGHTDNGNGTFSPNTCTRPTYGSCTRTVPRYETQPVYDTRYEFEIERWKHARYYPTKDNYLDDHYITLPHWEEDYALGEKEKVVKNDQAYTITFTHLDEVDETNFTKNYSQPKWDSLKINSIYILRKNRSSSWSEIVIE